MENGLGDVVAEEFGISEVFSMENNVLKFVEAYESAISSTDNEENVEISRATPSPDAFTCHACAYHYYRKIKFLYSS